MTKQLWLFPLLCTGLFGCGTSIYSDPIGPGEFSIRGISPGGMYSGFVGTTPSSEAVKEEAENRCPAGYDKTDEMSGAFFEGKFIEWRIRCHVQDPGHIR